MTPAVGNNTIYVIQRMECILYRNVMLFHIKLKKKLFKDSRYMCNRQNTFEFCKLNLKTSQKAVYECLLFKFMNRSVHIKNKFYKRVYF